MSRSHRAVFLLARGVQSAKAPLLHNRHSCLVHARCVPFITTVHKHLTPSILTCHHLESHHITSHLYSLPCHLRPWCHARNHRRRLSHCPCLHIPRRVLLYPCRQGPPLAQSHKTPSRHLRNVWCGRHGHVALSRPGKIMD